MKRAEDGEAKARAARLRELKDELATTLGYAPDQITGATKDRLNMAAALKLQHELCVAKLLHGGQLNTDELLRLTESVAALLPKAPWRADVRFIDNGLTEVAALSERLDKSERERCALLAEFEQLKRGTSGHGVVEITPASAPPREVSQAGSNVVPMKPQQSSPKPEHADAYAVLASVNAGFRSSPYINIDPDDRRDYGPRK
jgi:hypothetical protein